MYFLYECGLFYENVTHLVRLWLNYVQKYHLCSWCWQKNIAICDIWVKLHWYCFWECQRAVLFVIVWYCYFSYLYICICLVWKEASKYCLVCFGYQKVHFCPGLVKTKSILTWWGCFGIFRTSRFQNCPFIYIQSNIWRRYLRFYTAKGHVGHQCICDNVKIIVLVEYI